MNKYNSYRKLLNNNSKYYHKNVGNLYSITNFLSKSINNLEIPKYFITQILLIYSSPFLLELFALILAKHL